MAFGTFVLDRDGSSYGSLFRIDRVLYATESKYQKIMVFESKDLGRVLMLDDIFNVSPVMEAFYHEPMAHIPMAVSDGARSALIIGGGDFGVTRHLLKHRSLERVVLCELDVEVLETCRKFYPEWAKSEQDPRLRVHVENGYVFLGKCQPGEFDIIIVDSSDPFLYDAILISEDFYRRVHAALASGGILMQILADFIFYREVWLTVIPRVKPYFKVFCPLFVPIPFYVTGSWGLLLAGKDRDRLDPDRVSAAYLSGIPDIETLTPELVKGWFSVPPYVRKGLQGAIG